MTIAALIATKDRVGLLAERSLPSALGQTHQPTVVVVVNDGHELPHAVQTRLHKLGEHARVRVVLLRNRRTPGAGGAWNTGLEWIRDQHAARFVAILDDDDVWDSGHVEANLSAMPGADITVSGLRMWLGGRSVDRPLIDAMNARAFLVGNPGWQGSNTFVRLELLLRVGGFREGLQSLNDRDLAFRLLSHPDVRWHLVPRWTATWFADTPGNLSTPRSAQKREGLRAFWALYGEDMTVPESRRFFDRTQRLFGVEESSIRNAPDTALPVLGFPESCTDA